MTELPKILIISSQIPQTMYAGCLQLYRIFENYPLENLRAIGPVEPKAKQLAQTFDPFILPVRLSNTRFCRLGHSLNAIHLVPDLSVTKIDKLLGDFKPDLVVTLIELLPYAYAAHRYARKKKLPLMTITMDSPGDFTYVYESFVKARKSRMTKVFQYAKVNIGVSKEMAAFVKQTFKAKSDVLYFCPPEGLTSRAPEQSATLKNPERLTIGYAGSMSLGYGEQLTAMVKTFEKAGVQLNVYSHHQPPFSSSILNYRGSFSQYEVWDRIKEECDAVILPYYFYYGTEETSVYSTHFPTKLSEYLTLGMPVIVVGPKWATGVKWAMDHPNDVLYTIKEDEGEVLVIFDKLKNDAEARLQYSLNPVKAAESEFSPSVIKQQFLQYINKCFLN